jgi:hypothetical protein
LLGPSPVLKSLPFLDIFHARCSGFLTIAGSLCYAELGAMIPKAGGDYDYLLCAYGKLVGFSYTWFSFWISQSGGYAIIATIFGNNFVGVFSNLDEVGHNYTSSKLASVLLIIVLSGANCLAVKESSTLNNILTIIKFLLLTVVILSGFIMASQFNAGRSVSPPTLIRNLVPYFSLQRESLRLNFFRWNQLGRSWPRNECLFVGVLRVDFSQSSRRGDDRFRETALQSSPIGIIGRDVFLSLGKYLIHAYIEREGYDGLRCHIIRFWQGYQW